MYTSIVISQPSPSRKITPFQKRLESKEEAIGCTRTMMAQLQKILDCLQPADAKTTDAISSETEQSVRSLRATFERLCNAVGMHRDAERLPDVKKKAQDSSMIGLFPTVPKHVQLPKKEATQGAPAAPSRRKLLHKAKISGSALKVLTGDGSISDARRKAFDSGMCLGCKDFGIKPPQIEYDEMRFYFEDMAEIKDKFPGKSSYWLFGYAIAKYEKRNDAK